MLLSKKILDYHFFFKAFTAYIEIHFLELGITLEQKDAIVDAWDAWVLVFDDYVNPNEHNEISIGDVNSLYVTDHEMTEGVKTQISSNPSIELSGLDYVNLDIPRPKKPRTHVPAKDYAPTVSLISNPHLTPKFFAMDPTRPAKKGKPKDVAFIGLKICFTDVAATPPDADAYRIQRPEGNTIFEVICTGDKVGKRLWVICFYLSPTNEAGPDSAPFPIIIV